MLGFTQNFKLAILNMVKELNQTMSKEVKKNMRMMFYQIENVHKQIEIVKGIKWKLWRLKVQ